MIGQNTETQSASSRGDSTRGLAWRVLVDVGQVSLGEHLRLSCCGWQHLMARLNELGAEVEGAEHGERLLEVVADSGGKLPDGEGWRHVTSPKELPWMEALLMNANGRHFLQHARGGRLARRWPARVRSLRAFLERQGLEPSRVVFDSSLVLELYGLRPARDVDFLALDSIRQRERGFSANDAQLVHHGVSKQTLIEDPAFHLQVDGLRFVSFDQLRRLKHGRNRLKDRNDLRMMDALERGDRFALLQGWGVAQWVVMTIVLQRWARRLARRIRRRP
ncbi:hypothetical protein [Halomonas sp. 11-S5]|uniref:hypothetical protein n=1 Tax=Halomonas sp. 11-S5 TaxID=2994064 RepID=UPI002468A1B9|nr:hypothetical protein [Halomonas sp. 11-S5]